MLANCLLLCKQVRRCHTALSETILGYAQGRILPVGLRGGDFNNI